jgi:hypothetical protein
MKATIVEVSIRILLLVAFIGALAELVHCVRMFH